MRRNNEEESYSGAQYALIQLHVAGLRDRVVAQSFYGEPHRKTTSFCPSHSVAP